MIEEAVQCVVVGAGVVGLAVARALARSGREVIVLDKEGGIGTETSARNSEVIHAGLYYPDGSLKARLCVAGRDALYAYCRERGVPHKRLGKIIVATRDEETPALERIRQQARRNGVDDLVPLTAAEARALEPNLACVGALLSPSTGIIDSHALMLAYQGDAEAAGALVVLRAPVLGGRVEEGGFRLDVAGAEPMTLRCAALVNCGGNHATALSRAIAGIPAPTIPQSYYCRGVYFSLGGRAPFSRLIYPVPDSASLGLHFSVDMGGQAKFGPDTEWVDSLDYRVDPSRALRFYPAIRKYWPGLADGALQPGYAGIRPKITGPAEPAGDFVLQGPGTHGITGLVALYGIESPGLTASLAIAEAVERLLAGAPEFEVPAVGEAR